MKTMILYHMLAFTAGFILDLIIGDPYQMPHPVRWIGSFISFLEKSLRDPRENAEKTANRLRGFCLWLITVLATVLVTGALIYGTYRIHFVLGIVFEAILTCYCLATKSLKTESMKVYDALKTSDIEASRKAVSMIVGRDTQCLDEAGVAKAAVETVAENTSDGVIAPLLYSCLGGPVLGMLYKAVNTMDSMIGYHNDKFEDFGFFAAKADDVFNYIPSRISALLMICACGFFGKEYDGKRAAKTFKRDRYNHKSPNSAQTESVCAGALGLRLAGNAVYFGKLVKKPYIGEDIRPIEPEDIVRANRLMYGTAFLAIILCDIVLAIIYFAI